MSKEQKNDNSQIEAQHDSVLEISLCEIDEFPDHPFQIRDDEDMVQLVESIRMNGVMTPVVVIMKDDGRYEMVSGHRRKRACELAGLPTIRSVVKDMTYDQAVVYMVESNFQRSSILPSERAFAYKMRLDAINRQGKRSNPTCAPLVHKLKSRDYIAAEVGESREQIRRYIRLTYLVPVLLKLVDEGKIKMRPAVELSYLSKACQLKVYDQIELNQCTPSHDQTIRMRKLFDEKKLTPEAIEAIMMEEKPNQREKMKFNAQRVRSLLPKDVTPAKTEDFICEAIEFYCKYRSRQQNKQRSDRGER